MTTVPRVALTAEEAAESVGVSKETIMRAIRTGKLRAKRSGDGGGGKYLVTVTALTAWVDGLGDA
jgi:excisionase family DNA binding protein